MGITKAVRSKVAKILKNSPENSSPTHLSKAADSFYYAFIYSLSMSANLFVQFKNHINPFYIMIHPNARDKFLIDEMLPFTLVIYFLSGHYLACTYFIFIKKDTYLERNDTLLLIVHHFLAFIVFYIGLRYPWFGIILYKFFLFNYYNTLQFSIWHHAWIATIRFFRYLHGV
jgi:hypothetical protein